MPYASFEDLRAPGFGIVNESDAWLTGRPYGLPGTATIRLDQRRGGYHNPDGYHYNASMVGGGFGDADTIALTTALQTQMQQLIAAQQVQQQSLKRIAFWQMMTGSLVVGTIVIGAVFGIADAARGRRGARRGEEY